MVSLMHMTESENGLVLSYPWWVAVAFAFAAVALAVYTVSRRARMRRIWPATLAALVAAWAGTYVFTFRTAIDAEMGSAYASLRYDHTVRWKDAADIYLEHGGSGSDWRIVVIDRARRAYNFDVAELSIHDRDRIMAYMVDHMPESAFARAPELLKRRSADGARPVGLFADQQI